MAATVYRFKSVAVPAGDLARCVPGATVLGGTAPGIFVDVTADSAYRQDLVDYMASIGWAYDTTAPVDTPTESFQSASVTLSNQQVTATGAITTNSTNPVLASGMTVTPVAGTYMVMFTGSAFTSNISATQYGEVSVYSGGSKVAASVQLVADQNNYLTPFCSVAIVTVDGSQAIEGRFKSSTSNVTTTMGGTRTLTVVKIG